MKRFYLVRHGENRANLTKEFSCRHVDYSLTPKGILQAQQTAVYFKEKDIHAVYSSPLKRAAETAQIIAAELGLEVNIRDQFREVDVGELELLPGNAENWAFHDRVIMEWFSGNHAARFPGGEDFYDLAGRMRAGVAQIVANESGQNIVIVAHGGLFTFTLKDLCPAVDLVSLFKHDNHNCSITEITIGLENERLEGRLIAWASHAHLQGEAARLVSGRPKKDIASDT